MNICPTFVPNLQPSIAVQPRMRALDHPTVTTEPLLRFDPFTSDARSDAALTQGSFVLLRLISLVRVQLVRTFAGPPSRTLDGLDRVYRCLKHRRLVDVGSRQDDRERNALSVDHKMPLRALFAAIRWILPGFFAPPGAATEAASTQARLQSMRSASPSWSRRTWWSPSQTPAFCQSRSRRQQVIPEPHPISGGSISQGVPVISTNRMPVKAARSGIRGRPPFGQGFCVGSKGSITAHSSSETIGLAESIQQDLVEAVPDASGLPVAKTAPAGHPRTAPHLGR